MSLAADDGQAGASRIDPEEFRETASRLLAARLGRPQGHGGGRNEPGADDALYAEMVELGWMLLLIPESAGGIGQGFDALGPIYEELGRARAPVWIADTLAASEYLAGAGPSAVRLLEQIGAGTARPAIAFDPAAGTAADRVSGTFEPILGGASTTHLLLVNDAVGTGGAAWIDLGGDCVERRTIDTWDRSRAVSQVVLKNAPIDHVLTGASDAGRALRAHLDLAIAWDSVGGAGQALQKSVAYMQTRQQFGRLIGSFQALKHRAADLKVALEIAAALTRKATASFSSRTDGWALSAAQAKLLACETYRSIAEENIQFHGGIGFTSEHDAHLFFKRAWLNEMLGGTADEYRDRIAPAILQTAECQKRAFEQRT